MTAIPPATGPPRPPQTPEATFDGSKLDELIPRPMGPWRKLAIGAFLVSTAIAWMLLGTGGYLWPQAPHQSAFVNSMHYLDQDEGLIGLLVRVPNTGGRDLRLTDVKLDGRGIDVVRVEVAPSLLQRNNATITEYENGQSASVALPAREFHEPPAGVPLPAVLDANRPFADGEPEIIVWFRPTECIDVGEPWGFVEVTVDFGDGAFPPIARTFNNEEPVWNGPSEQPLRMWGGDGFIEADGPLALACEVLQ